METKFQTSFIPKKPIIPAAGPAIAKTHHSTSFLLTFSIVLFIISLAGAGGAFAWKRVLESTQERYKKQLAKKEEQFRVDDIERLKTVNIKIDLGQDLLKKHLALSAIFDIISRMTIENVRFADMELSAFQADSSDIKISMKGQGSNLSAVAFQSSVLGELEKYGLRNVIKNPILSNPTLDTGGSVSFGFTASIDPSKILYEKIISTPPQQQEDFGDFQEIE